VKHTIKWAGILIIVFVMAVIFISTNRHPDPQPPSTADQVTTAAKKQHSDPEYKIGDIVKMQNLAYKVNKVDSAKQIGSGIVHAKADGYFLMVNLTVTNQGKEAETIDSSMFTLVEGNGKEYDANGVAAMYIEGNNNFFLDKLQPHAAKIGYVVFDVPTIKGEYSLRVTGELRAKEGKLIRLER
jgi:hypothetical protein